MLLPLVALLGCSGPKADSPKPSTETTTMPRPAPLPPPAYQGPACSAAFGNDAISVTVNAPSGGYALKLDRIAHEGPLARVELTLTSPGEGELVTMAFESKLAIATLEKPCTKALVLISQERRGVQYFKKPDHELAATLSR